MAKARRRTQRQRIGDRLERQSQGEDARTLGHIRSVIAEHDRRRFWLRLGCPVGPLST